MIDTSLYTTHVQSGEFTGTFDTVKWGRNTNLICFFTLDDGSKSVCNTWWRQDYLGARDIPLGSRVRLHFEMNKKGKAYLKDISQITDHE